MFVSSLYQKLIKINNQKLSKLLSEWFGRSVCWNKYKTKSENKNATNEYSYFLESNFVANNSLFLSIYLSKDNDVKRLKTRRYYLSIKRQSYSQWKTFLWLSHWCRYKMIQTNRKLTTGKGEDYTTEILLDYKYIKNHYRLITIDWNRQKESDADWKVIQKIKFVGKLKLPMA